MRDSVLPLRPLTSGEILDAAVALVRRHAVPLLVSGALLAVLEQAALYPLRRQALLTPHYWELFAPWDWPLDILDAGAFWLLVALGLGTESLIITLIGGLAAPAARAALLGAERARPQAGGTRRLAGEQGAEDGILSERVGEAQHLGDEVGTGGDLGVEPVDQQHGAAHEGGAHDVVGARPSAVDGGPADLRRAGELGDRQRGRAAGDDQLGSTVEDVRIGGVPGRKSTRDVGVRERRFKRLTIFHNVSHCNA